MNKIYKYGFLSVCGLLGFLVLYLSYLGSGVALDMLASSRLDGMTREQAECIAMHKEFMNDINLR